MPSGVRARLFRWFLWAGFLVALVAGLMFFAPHKFQRLWNLMRWRTPEQKRLLKAYDGPPKAPSAGPRTYYVPKH